MKLRIWKYIIEEDRFGWILKEMVIRKEGKNIWEEMQWDFILFPSTFERALLLLSHKLKKDKNNEYNLEEYIEEIKNINNEFLKNLQSILKDYDLNEK